MVLPQNANVYYAVNTAFNLNFILRPKRSSPLDSAALGRAKPPKKSPLPTWTVMWLGGESQMSSYWYYCYKSWWHKKCECGFRTEHELSCSWNAMRSLCNMCWVSQRAEETFYIFMSVVSVLYRLIGRVTFHGIKFHALMYKFWHM